MAMRFRPPVELEGRYTRLVPLDRSMAPALARAGRSPEIWTYWRTGPHDTEVSMAEFIVELLGRQQAGTDLPFAVLDRASGAAIGMTRYLEIDRENGAVEIGGTWFDPSYWRTPVNTDTKRLMFGHAFDTERAHRVQLKTDLRNERSQRAIERLGAVREGVLRDHLVNRDGHRRSSVYFSVLADEWPTVRQRLDEMLARPWAARPS